MTTLVTKPITGSEEPDASAPTGALAEFYRAFNGRDLPLMSQNWLHTDEASMDNPLGGIRRGWGQISEVYKRLFSGTGIVNVEFHDYTIHHEGGTFLAVGSERGTFRAGSTTIELKIRTSRWFKRSGERWRQLHHHGSIDDADLLSRYQAAVR